MSKGALFVMIQVMDILQIDQSILQAVNSFLVGKSVFLDLLIEFSAVYLVYLLPIILLILWFKYKHRRLEIFLSFIAMALAWFVITKTIVPELIWFRPRPDLAAFGAKELLFHRPDYSFPSDHATALFALTFGFYTFGWKRVGNWFLVYALTISFFRVTVGVHFPLDILGGILSALIGVGVVKLLESPMKQYAYPLVMKILKTLRIP